MNIKKEYLYLALAALLLPILVRAFWFYRGVADRPEIATPDFASFSAPDAPVNVSEADEEIPQLDGVVVIDTIHSNQFSMTEIVSLTSAIQARGGEIETADGFSLDNQLKYASAFISFSPTLPFNTFEIEALKNFAERGGKILLFTDATRNTIIFDFISGNPTALSDASAANSLLRNFDITVNNDYLYNTQDSEGNFRNVFFDTFGKSELTFGLTQIALYGTHSVESPSGTILLQGAETNLSSSNDANSPNQGGAALSQNGNVAAFGDLTFLASPYNTYTDNAKLITNIADFALAGKQNITLQNMPFVFSDETVSLYISSDLNKNTDLITALGNFQTSLRFMGVEVEFVDAVPTSGDTIIISTFTMDEKTEAIVSKFGVVFDSSVTTIEFGEVSDSGTGFILLDATSKGTRLILLANTPEDVNALIGVASAGNISSCLSSEKIAVCSVGFGGDDFFSGDDFFFEDSLLEQTPTDGSIPEATPTPGG